jgi:YHS domain-containing protein/mono/diheme cytochrome c family protein
MVLTFTLSFPPALFAGEGHRHEQMEHGMETKAPAAKHVVVDPVCGMSFKPEDAADKVEYEGKTYYFCMQDDAAAFRKDPQKYLDQQTPPAGHDHMKGHDHGEAHHPPKAEEGEKGHHSMGGHEDHGMHGAHWMAPEAEGKKKNPVAASTESAARGREMFTTHCAVCHGSGGKGDGFLAATLDPKPADLTGKMARMHPDGDLFWKISTGRGTMPGWAEAFSKEDRWHLIHYIRSLQK